ncbi:hypothetical protein LJK88_39075 [Paenibacillus sp. P26]|nr:hypothetical protein LJK88_39075 [Paenibacillus sp. P26]UUZ93094.1 hypothetical protein LJK87_49215 [Paenibacillus sp. P25]
METGVSICLNKKYKRSKPSNQEKYKNGRMPNSIGLTAFTERMAFPGLMAPTDFPDFPGFTVFMEYMEFMGFTVHSGFTAAITAFTGIPAVSFRPR